MVGMHGEQAEVKAVQTALPALQAELKAGVLQPVSHCHGFTPAPQSRSLIPHQQRQGETCKGKR